MARCEPVVRGRAGAAGGGPAARRWCMCTRHTCAARHGVVRRCAALQAHATAPRGANVGGVWGVCVACGSAAPTQGMAAPRTHTHTHTHARAHTRALTHSRARARAHTHTPTPSLAAALAGNRLMSPGPPGSNYTQTDDLSTSVVVCGMNVKQMYREPLSFMV